MRITLDEIEVMKAVTVYMALRGIDTGEDFYFHWEKTNNDFKGITLGNATPNKKYNIEKIKAFAIGNG